MEGASRGVNVEGNIRGSHREHRDDSPSAKRSLALRDEEYDSRSSDPITLTDTSYTPDLAYNTTYYWQVVPFNTTGDAVDCPVWSFSTTKRITAFPYTEDFSGATIDIQRRGWTTGLWSFGSGYASVPISNNSILVTPQLQLPTPNAAPNHSMFLTYQVRSQGAGTITYEVLVSTTGQAPEDFTQLFTENITNTAFATKTINLAEYEGDNIYIAFKRLSGSTTLNLDNVWVGGLYLPFDLSAEHAQGNTKLQWNISDEASHSTFETFKVSRNGSQIGTTTELFYVDDTAQDGTRYDYAVSAVYEVAEIPIAIKVFGGITPIRTLKTDLSTIEQSQLENRIFRVTGVALNENGVFGDNQIYLQDSNGGMLIDFPTDIANTVQIGDVYSIYGQINDGEISILYDFEEAEATVPAFEVLTITYLNGLSETTSQRNYQGRLIALQNVHIVGFDPTTGIFELSDEQDNVFYLRRPSNTSWNFATFGTAPFSITGILTARDEISPRSLSDRYSVETKFYPPVVSDVTDFSTLPDDWSSITFSATVTNIGITDEVQFLFTIEDGTQTTSHTISSDEIQRDGDVFSGIVNFADGKKEVTFTTEASNVFFSTTHTQTLKFFAGTTPIRTLKMALDSEDYFFKIEGVALNNHTVFGENRIYLQDTDGGMHIDFPAGIASSVQIGDVYSIYGQVMDMETMRYISFVNEESSVSPDFEILSMQYIADLDDDIFWHDYHSRLIGLENVSVIGFASATGIFTLNDSEDNTFYMRRPSGTSWNFTTFGSEPFDIIGILTDRDEISPRSLDDKYPVDTIGARFYTITGMMMDAETEEALSGVMLTLTKTGDEDFEMLYSTVDDGLFSFEELHAGEYILSFEKEYYESDFITITIIDTDITLGDVPMEHRVSLYYSSFKMRPISIVYL